jgi:hypothetical protein
MGQLLSAFDKLTNEQEEELTILFHLELTEYILYQSRYAGIFIPLKVEESKNKNAIQLYDRRS